MGRKLVGLHLLMLVPQSMNSLKMKQYKKKKKKDWISQGTWQLYFIFIGIAYQTFHTSANLHKVFNVMNLILTSFLKRGMAFDFVGISVCMSLLSVVKETSKSETYQEYPSINKTNKNSLELRTSCCFIFKEKFTGIKKI